MARRKRQQRVIIVPGTELTEAKLSCSRGPGLGGGSANEAWNNKRGYAIEWCSRLIRGSAPNTPSAPRSPPASGLFSMPNCPRQHRRKLRATSSFGHRFGLLPRLREDAVMGNLLFAQRTLDDAERGLFPLVAWRARGSPSRIGPEGSLARMGKSMKERESHKRPEPQISRMIINSS